jgi:predicted nucleic acid-binding protein
MRAIVNNTVLSNLANVRRSDLLRRLFDPEVVAPGEVLTELKAGERLHRIPEGQWSWLRQVQLTSGERALAARLRRTVDAGEAACLAVASARNWMFLTDDRDARRLAQLMVIPISGTLGILQASVDEEYLDLALADQLLTEMVEAGYRSPVRSLRELKNR